MSTYELILLTLKGDQNAARALVKILTPIFQKEAQYAIWRVRGTLEDVKELINDIFADLFSDRAARLRRFDPEKGATPEGYFRRFARLRCMGFARDERDRLLERLTEPADLSELHAGPNPRRARSKASTPRANSNACRRCCRRPTSRSSAGAISRGRRPRRSARRYTSAATSTSSVCIG